MREKSSKYLHQEVVRGGSWTFVSQISVRFLDVFKLLFLARLLSPDDFGLLGIALLVQACLNDLSATGFHSAIIQEKELTDSHLNSAWSLGILRGFILTVFIYFIAPSAAQFFNSLDAKEIIRVTGYALFLSSFQNIGVVLLHKDIQFKRLSAYHMVNTLAKIVVTITLTCILRNVWALVIGHLAGTLFSVMVSYLICPYRPRFQIDLKISKKLWKYGKWIFVLSTISLLVNKGDDFVVGKVLGVAVLGFYRLAYSIAMLPATSLSDIISKITFPAFSKIQDDIPRLKDAYLKTLKLTAFLSFPLAGFIVCFAPDFTLMFLGVTWMPMVAALQILAILGLNRSIGSTRGPLFKAVGRPQIVTKIQLTRLGFLAVLIYPMTQQWGIVGTGGSILLTGLFLQIYGTQISTKILGCRFTDIIDPLIAPLVLTLVSINIVAYLRISLFSEMVSSSYLSFFTLAFLALGIYLSAFIVTDRYWHSGIVPLLKEQWTLLKSPGI